MQSLAVSFAPWPMNEARLQRMARFPLLRRPVPFFRATHCRLYFTINVKFCSHSVLPMREYVWISSGSLWTYMDQDFGGKAIAQSRQARTPRRLSGWVVRTRAGRTGEPRAFRSAARRRVARRPGHRRSSIRRDRLHGLPGRPTVTDELKPASKEIAGYLSRGTRYRFPVRVDPTA